MSIGVGVQSSIIPLHDYYLIQYGMKIMLLNVMVWLELTLHTQEVLQSNFGQKLSDMIYISYFCTLSPDMYLTVCFKTFPNSQSHLHLMLYS